MKKLIAFIALFGCFGISYAQSVSVIVDSPQSWSVATPLLHIKARCIDTAGCKLSVSGDEQPGGINYSEIYLGSSIDTVIDLSGNEGAAGYIIFTTYDDQGRAIYVYKRVFVENNSYLTSVFTAGDQILDFNYNTVFVSNPSWGPLSSQTDLNPYVYRSRIVNILTGDSIPLNYQGPLSGSLETNPSPNHILTPYGAIFSAVDTTSYLQWLYDSNSGSLDSLGPLNSGVSLHVSGNYAIWSNGNTLYSRQLQTATNTTISTSAVNFRNDVTPSGIITYGGRDFNIYRYASNSSTAITNTSDGKYNLYPLTDGHTILYTKSDPCCTNQHYSVRLYNGTMDTLLSDMDTISPSPMTNYQVNNGYIAYTKPDSAYHLQVWLIDTSGKSSQLTSFAWNSTIDLLNSNGDLTFISGTESVTSQRYFASRTTGKITAIGTANGQVYYRDSLWYLSLGRVLYEIDPALYPLASAKPQVSGVDNSYCSNQGIQKLKLLNFPDSSISVKVTLDSVNLRVAADSTVSFDVSKLGAGRHVLEIVYTNATGSQTLTDAFTVTATVTPVVKLSSSVSTVTNLLDSVVITANAIAGGGSTPLYTFSIDRNFTIIQQAEGAINVFNIAPNTLTVGITNVYVRMRTSDSCVTSPTAFDSLQLTRNGTTGVVDPDFPNTPISSFPNPFGGSLVLSGFQTSKTYWITIRNSLGQPLFQREVSNSNSFTLQDAALQVGMYWLSIFDYNKNKLIGTMMIFKQ